MRISTIIPTYKQDDLCILHALEAQRGSLPPNEIIIVNDGGPDFAEVLRDLDWTTKVVYVQLLADVLWNITGAKNTGIWLATGDMLTLEDCDHIPGRKTYMCAHDILSSQAEVVAVKPARVKYASEEKYRWGTNCGELSAGSGTVIARASDVKAVCGFAEYMAGCYGGDDIDFRRRLATQGRTVVPTDFEERYAVILSGKAEGPRNQGQRQGGTGICRVPFTVTRIN